MTLRPSIPLYQARGSVLVTGPASEPVTAAELRAHLVIDAAALPDAEANALIAEARQEIEDRSGIAFLPQTWRLSLDRWPAYGEAWWDGVREVAISSLYQTGIRADLALPRFPLASITSVSVYNDAGEATAVNVGNTFNVDLYSMPGRLTLKGTATWPVALRSNDAIQILYVAGYANAGAVPAPLKRAVKLLAGYMFAHRGDECSPAEAFDMSGAADLVSIYKPARI